jgi:hypothetical protein
MTTATDRQQYRELVAQVAAKARAILPQAVNGRLEGAVKLTPCGRTFFLRHVSDTPPSSHL